MEDWYYSIFSQANKVIGYAMYLFKTLTRFPLNVGSYFSRLK
jgi:hypothetical protein